MKGNDIKRRAFLKEVSFGALGAAFLAQGLKPAKGASRPNNGTAPAASRPNPKDLSGGGTSRPHGRIKAFCIDFNWGPGGINAFAGPGVWADADPAQHVAWYEGLGVNVIQTFAVSCNGYAWYKGGVVPENPGLKYNFLSEMVKLGRAKGKLVVGYYCIAANVLWAQRHPDLSYGNPPPADYHIPLTAAYLDYLTASIQDALQKTGMDGFMIDWVWNPKRPGGRWLGCEKQSFAELMGRTFPGEDKLTKEDLLDYERKAINRCWSRIHQAAKEVKRDCIIWLSCNNLLDPTLANSPMLRELDWLQNENPDTRHIAAVRNMIGSYPRIIITVSGWGDKMDAYKVLNDAANREFGVYGFARPGANSLMLPIKTYLSKPYSAFSGNDRNIAVLARFFNNRPFDYVEGKGAAPLSRADK
jgi:hypothetical protein